MARSLKMRTCPHCERTYHGNGAANHIRRCAQPIDHAARFWAKVCIAEPWDCWEWQGSRLGTGYGAFYHSQGADKLAHRWAWRFFGNTIPEGKQIDHLCRNRACVNPCHLEVVDPGENVRRGEAGYATGALYRARTHCPHGHKYTPENIIPRPSGYRQCRECERIRSRKRDKEFRAANPLPPRVPITHCHRGHPLSGDNLYVDPRGGRQCKECNKRRGKEFHQRRKEQRNGG